MSSMCTTYFNFIAGAIVVAQICRYFHFNSKETCLLSCRLTGTKVPNWSRNALLLLQSHLLRFLAFVVDLPVLLLDE